MKYTDRRRYRAWLQTALAKESLNREEIEKIICGQLMLPVREIDGGLLKECFAALETPGGESDFAHEDRTWLGIRRDIASMESGSRAKPAVPNARRMAVLILAAVLLLALAAAAIAAALGYRIFGFPMPADHPASYVQEGAYDLTRRNLVRVSYDHVDVEVREAIYDGKELRVVYSVRDRSASKRLAEEDKYHPMEAAGLDGVLSCCDWVSINGQDVMLSDVGEEPGDLPGEMLYSFSALLSDQDVHPEGVFSVGLPLRKDEAGRTYAPSELTFTLNAQDARKWVRTAGPADTFVGDFHIAMTEAEFSPLSGAVLLVITDKTQANAQAPGESIPNNETWPGKEPSPLEEEAFRWGGAQLFTPDGIQVGLAGVAYWSYREGPGIMPLMLRVTPPQGDGWPAEMILVVCDDKGNKDTGRSIPIRLQ